MGALNFAYLDLNETLALGVHNLCAYTYLILATHLEQYSFSLDLQMTGAESRQSGSSPQN